MYYFTNKKEVSLSAPGMEMETITDYQKIKSAKKIKKMFGHLDRDNLPVYCPIRDVMAVASDKWSINILLNLGFFPILRFNELKKKIVNISNKMLSERLKTLEADGYVSRKMYPEVPIRVEYKLTNLGYSYLEKLIELTEWSHKHGALIMENRKNFKR